MCQRGGRLQGREGRLVNARVSPSWLSRAGRALLQPRLQGDDAAPRPGRAALSPSLPRGHTEGVPVTAGLHVQCIAGAMSAPWPVPLSSRGLSPPTASYPGSPDEAGRGCVSGSGRQGGGRQAAQGRQQAPSGRGDMGTGVAVVPPGAEAGQQVPSEHHPVHLYLRILWAAGRGWVRSPRPPFPCPPRLPSLTSLGRFRELQRVQAVDPQPFQPPPQALLLVTQPVLGLPRPQLLLLQPLRGSGEL